MLSYNNFAVQEDRNNTNPIMLCGRSELGIFYYFFDNVVERDGGKTKKISLLIACDPTKTKMTITRKYEGYANS